MMMIAGCQAERVVKAYARCMKLRAGCTGGSSNEESVKDLVTISEEGIKRNLLDKKMGAQDKTAASGHRSNTQGVQR